MARAGLLQQPVQCLTESISREKENGPAIFCQHSMSWTVVSFSSVFVSHYSMYTIEYERDYVSCTNFREDHSPPQRGKLKHLQRVQRLCGHHSSNPSPPPARGELGRLSMTTELFEEINWKKLIEHGDPHLLLYESNQDSVPNAI